MSQIHKHTIPANIADRCLINPQQYEAMYQQSINVPDTFWGEQGKILDWIKPYQKVKNTSFAPGNVSIKWYEDGTLNLAANCLDRHLQENGDRTAIIWEGDDASQSKHISYKELHRDVCRFANTLLELGIKKGNPLEGATEGSLVITDSWPGQARTLFGDHERFEQTYFSTFKNMYFSGDGARRDEDGYYWITGRVDDVLNVSGHRLGTAEIESALVAHPKIAEAAVVGIPHNIKGQAIYAYVTLNHGEEPSPELYAEVRNWVRKEIGPLATPDVLHWTDSLPKTRSGKIMRRILRKIAAGDTSNLGDTSTLADPGVVEKLLEEKQAIAMPS